MCECVRVCACAGVIASKSLGRLLLLTLILKMAANGLNVGFESRSMHDVDTTTMVTVPACKVPRPDSGGA